MIHFYEEDITYTLNNEDSIILWIKNVIAEEEFFEGAIDYIFCSDAFLLELNQAHLNHNTLTDIITFDFTVGKTLHAEIFISIPRVIENAKIFEIKFETELCRVLIHGILHCMGYKDKTPESKNTMREKEDYYLSKLF